MAPLCLHGAHSPQNLVESQPGEREGLPSYFLRISKTGNHESVIWRRGWERNNPRRATGDPAPNLCLVTVELNHGSVDIPVFLGISCPWVHSHGAHAARVQGGQ